MKSGANVPDAASPLSEFALCRLTFPATGAGDDGDIDDKLRKCPLASTNFPDVTIADFGRGVFPCVPGDEDGDERPNGLARLGEPFNWEGSILSSLQRGIIHAAI